MPKLISPKTRARRAVCTSTINGVTTVFRAAAGDGTRKPRVAAPAVILDNYDSNAFLRDFIGATNEGNRDN